MSTIKRKKGEKYFHLFTEMRITNGLIGEIRYLSSFAVCASKPTSNGTFSLKLLLQKRRELSTKFSAFETEFDGGFKVAKLGAAVIANADRFNRVDGFR